MFNVCCSYTVRDYKSLCYLCLYISPLSLGTYLCAIPLNKFVVYSTFIL